MDRKWLVVSDARQAVRPEHISSSSPPSLPKILSLSPTAICGIPLPACHSLPILSLSPFQPSFPSSCLDHCVQTGGVFQGIDGSTMSRNRILSNSSRINWLSGCQHASRD